MASTKPCTASTHSYLRYALYRTLGFMRLPGRLASSLPWRKKREFPFSTVKAAKLATTVEWGVVVIIVLTKDGGMAVM